MNSSTTSPLIQAYRRLPARVRERLKCALGSAGHRGGVLDRWRAQRLAKGSKKASQLASFCRGRLLDAAGGSLDGARVMEYGAGFLMAEPLIYSMFGAARVDAVDYNPVLCRTVLKRYAMTSDWKEAMEIAGVVIGEDRVKDWKARLDAALQTGLPDWFESLGIRYVAPYDVVKLSQLEPRYDLIVSQSTLEHVPADLAETILARLADQVLTGGGMYHYIHLEDHRDFAHNPFAFLGNSDDYRLTDADLRGNRLRASDWRSMMNRIPSFEWTEFPHAIRQDVGLPEMLDPAFNAYNQEDLRQSHLTIMGRRIEA